MCNLLLSGFLFADISDLGISDGMLSHWVKLLWVLSLERDGKGLLHLGFSLF